MEDHLTAAQQYFPHYKLDPKRADIGLKEYDLAAKALEADHKSLTAAAGVVLFFSGIITTIIGANDGLPVFARVANKLGTSLELFLSMSVLLVAVLSIHYFSRLQRSATYAARKIVVLRRLLGLDYGNIESVLPADQLDGANEPFAIAMFPGWRSLQALPVLVVAAVSALAQAAIFAAFEVIEPRTDMWFLGGRVLASTAEIAVLVGVSTLVVLFGFYRYSLYESFETTRLFVAKFIANDLRIPLKKRIGYILYRMNLSVYEAKRLGIKLEEYYDMLVHIEDRRYYIHNGNSIKSASSAICRFMKYRTKSGGSTIYQQLARSNFLTVFSAPIRRKIIEWVLAPWLSSITSKADGLNLYLCSVRFAPNVIGLPAAIRHYFPGHNLKQPLASWQRFLLIERLSNVSSTFPAARINSLARTARNHGMLSDPDFSLLNAAYSSLARDNKIKLAGVIPQLQP